MAFHVERNAAFLQQAPRNIGCSCGIDAGHDQHELVPTKAGQGIPAPHHGRQALRNPAQQLVAHAVPKGVVDPLEVIQIEKHQGDGGFITFRCRQQLFDPVMQQAAIGQPGERIKVGEVANFFLGQPLPGKVEHRTHRRRPTSEDRGRYPNADRNEQTVLANDRHLVTRLG